MAKIIFMIPIYIQHLGERILIIDGHGSHLTLGVLDAAREANVEFFCLLPHTMHIAQPLDVALYAPLKSYF